MKNILSFGMLFVISTFTLLFSFSQSLYSQLKIDSKAPKITPTTWLTKQNKAIDLKNKFIVLEFWATWCAPCLGALPHMNELQDKFKQRKDLIFLSLTDEKVEKIKRILPNFHFKSTIITDISGTTFRSYKIETLPTTFLIDDRGVIKWIGEPTELTENLIKSLTKREPLITSTVNKVISSAPDTTLINSYKTLFYDAKTTQAFAISSPNNQHLGISSSRINKSFYNQYQIGVSLAQILSKLLHCNKNQLDLPDDLRNKAISYCYKQDKLQSIEEGEKILLNKIFNSLHLTLTTSDKLKDIFNIVVVDSAKLNAARVINTSRDIQSGSSITNDLVVFSISNGSLIALEELFNKTLDLNVTISNKDLFKDRYDITIKNTSFEEFEKSLKIYGLEVHKIKSQIKTFQLELQK